MSGMKFEQQAYTLENGGFSGFYEKNNKRFVIEFISTLLEALDQMDLKDVELAFIVNALEHYQKHPDLHEFWKIIEDHDLAYKQVMEFLSQHQDYTALLKPYLEKKFNQTTVEDILNEINKLLETTPFLLKNRCFQILAIQKTAYAVGDSTDIFKASQLVNEFNVTNPEVDFTKLKEKMVLYCVIAILDEIDLQTITLGDIESFGTLTAGGVNVKDLKDSRIKSKYRMMMVLVEIFSSSVVSVAIVLKQLPLSNREELREVLKSLLRNHLSYKYFQHVMAAFDNEEGSFHYPQLFAYISKHAGEGVMLSFIKWTANNLRLDHHYHRGLKNYLKTHPRSVWKKKKARIELQSIPSSSFRKIVKEVKSETATPVFKLFNKYGLQLAILLLTLGIGGGLFLGYDLLGDKKVTVSKASKPAAAVPAETTEQEVSLEPFKKWAGEKPVVFTAAGKEQKVSFAKGNPLGGKSLVLTDSQNIETPFDLVMDSETSPFDAKGVLKEGFSLYHALYDFDANGTAEVIFMALSQTFESFVWVYSPISENGSVVLRPDLAVKGMSDAKLVDNTLKLLGDQGQSETYTYLNQQFVKQ
ncbi:hypothetical protein [Neobacillus niacini]|uniref:hypothetical protein n=1 Tax=Neobacillus niacini TaxID=86668 RepID=UPI001C8D47B8|nr:hypothetical protein [Neobacillus niacini]MBY0146310.1 hypothetical protein [Neobacillus niacini]